MRSQARDGAVNMLSPAEQVASAFVLFQASMMHKRTIEEITGKSREAGLVNARRDIAKELRDTYSFSLLQIGQVLGFRHHTTVLNLLDGKDE